MPDVASGHIIPRVSSQHKYNPAVVIKRTSVVQSKRFEAGASLRGVQCLDKVHCQLNPLALHDTGGLEHQDVFFP